MKIIDIRTRCLTIPLNARLRHNTGEHPGYFLTTILEIITDRIMSGLGRVGGGVKRTALQKLKPRILEWGVFPSEKYNL